MNLRYSNKRVKPILATAMALTLILMCVSCGKKDAENTDGTSATENTVSTDTTATEPTEPTEDPTESESVDQFIDDNFGDYGEDDEYDFKDEVGGKPVIDYGVIDGDGGTQIYDPKDPEAPSVHKPDPKPAEPTEPTEKPTEPTEPYEPTVPSETEGDTEPTEPDTPPVVEPVPPQNIYSMAVAGIGDYIADVKYVCEVVLTDGSVTKYQYKYTVENKQGVYSATYMDKGAKKSTVFDMAAGTMTTDGVSKAAAKSDFYRFCSMVEPLPLGVYYFERSEAGVDFTATMSAENHKALLLNTSPLFTGFDKMEGVQMGKLYFNGHVDAESRYTGSEMAFDIKYNDKTLGDMLFRISIDIDYVY